MDDPVGFGYWLRRRRKALDLTQTQFAQRVGCSLKTVQKLEAEERRPSLAMAERLADVLALAPADRASFLKVARAERSSVALVVPTQPSTPASQPTSDSKRTNLPRPRDRLIGRERDVEAVAERLRRGDVGLVTLTGPGGIGKTRVSVAVASEVRDAFPDGVWFVALASVSDPTLVAATIATALGVQPVGSEPLLESLMAYLREKQLLLVLDNFEQVVAAAPLLADLLHAAPHLTLLVTSRTVLGVYGEHDIAVPPLALPDPMRLPPLDALMHYAAVQLFCERAQAAAAAFALTHENAHAVVEICQRLDGLPLALELAASRVRLLPPLVLLARLSSRLQLLTGGPRTLPVRQQTLRDTIAWSYDLLDAADQTLFRWLSVFVGGWTLEAAEAICAAGSAAGPRVLDGLQALVDTSLVQQVEGADGAPRFTLLETIGEYAREAREASGEVEAVRKRHADYFLALAEAAEPKLASGERLLWQARLDAEHDNLLAALTWSHRAQKHAIEVRLAGALTWYWFCTGYLREGRQHLEQALADCGLGTALRGAPHDATVQHSNIAKALFGAGLLAYYQSDKARAATLIEASIERYRLLGDRRGLGYALVMLGSLRQGTPAAVAPFEESVALFRETDDRWGLAWALRIQANIVVDKRDAARLHQLRMESHALNLQVGDPWGVAGMLICLSWDARDRGDFSTARAYQAQGLSIYRDLGNKTFIAIALRGMAHATEMQRDVAAMQAVAPELLELGRELGVPDHVATALRCLAWVAAARGEYDHATSLFAESLVIWQDLGWSKDAILTLLGLARMAIASGAAERGVRLLSFVETCAPRMQPGVPPGSLQSVGLGAGGEECRQALPGRDQQASRRLLPEEFGAHGLQGAEHPFDRTAFDADLATGRAALKEADFATAWAEGQVMTLEQAITAALEEDEEHADRLHTG